MTTADVAPSPEDVPSAPPSATPFTAPLGRIPDNHVRLASAAIERSGLLTVIEQWKDEERSGPGGRPTRFPTKALLVAIVLCAADEQPMLVTSFTEMMFKRISPTLRHELAIPKPPAPDDHKSWDNCYRNVRTRLHDLRGLMDPSPTPKNRRHDPLTFDALVEQRRSEHSPEQWAEREERLIFFTNQILEMSLRFLPREVRRAWKGSAAVDATVIPTFARPARRERRTKKGVQPKTIRHSADPDADWYHRDKQEGKDGEGELRKSVWGYEATLVVAGSDDPGHSSAMPSLVLGMTLHKPGHQVGQNAIRALASVSARKHPAGYLAADRAYPQSKPEDFQLPARALGYAPVFDLKIDQLGLQGSHAGMIQVDSTWYCPGMPETLVNATKESRNGKIGEVTHRARIEERRRYQIRTRGVPDAQGHARMRCPASQPAPTVRCANKPASEGGDGKVRTRIPVTDALSLHPPKICSQQSVTLPPEAGAKFSQELPHETPEWHAVYATLRNSVEGMNGFIKDGAHEAVDDPERRRIRGLAAQSVLLAFQLFAANLRKIEEFLKARTSEFSKKVRRLPSRRRTKSLSAWAPATGGPAEPTDTTTDNPDPPLTA